MSDKVVHFLSRFSKADRKLFRSFLESPVFNRREKVIVLYDFVLSHLDKKADKELNEEAAFLKIYPQEKFVVNKVRKLKAALVELVLDFLAFRNWREKGNPGINLLRALNEMGEDVFFQSYYQKAQANLEKENHSLQAMEAQVQLELQRSVFESKQTGRGGTDNFKDLMISLESSELTRIMKFVFISQMREKIIGEQTCPQVFLDLVNQISPESLSHPLARMYYLLCTTISPTSDWNDLQSLKQLLREQGDGIASDEVRDLYLAAINNFNRQEGHPKDELYEELWTLNKDMYELLVKSRGFSLSRGQYKNMVMLGCRLARFDWVEEFLEEALPHILANAGEVEELRGFNHGVMHFYRKNHEEAERAFNRSFKKIPDIFYELDARAYLLMIYLETGDAIGMESLTHSFRVYLEREERVSDFHRKSYGDFIRFYRRLAALRPGDVRKTEKLKNEIAQSEMRTGQNWLLEKLQAL